MEPQDCLNHGLVYLFAWMSGHVRYCGDHARELPTIQQWVDYLAGNGNDVRTAREHYTLVQVIQDGQIVAIGFFQCDGKDVDIHWIGAEDAHQRQKIADRLLRWYLCGLPNSVTTGTVTLDALKSNTAMRAWCQQFGAKEIDRNDSVVIIFTVAAARAKLGSTIPDDGYCFQPTCAGLEFHVCYAGVHPNFVDPAHPPIFNEPRPVW